MNWKTGNIKGLVIKPAAKHRDDRGWLAEVFRSDEIPAEAMPVMCYVSVTHTGVSRGPHKHVYQTDMFAFFGPGDFRIKAWDARDRKSTRLNSSHYS